MVSGARPGSHGAAVALAGALMAAMSLLAAGCTGSAGAQGAVPSPSHQATAAPSPGTASTGTGTGISQPGASPSVIAVPPPPARLHQTRALPRTRTRVFRAEMTDLWTAVRTGRFAPALQAFFPLAAYEQVKAIADPAADWHARLLGSFRLDVAAAHRFLCRGAGNARLVRVIVPSAEAAWINPGVCENSVGYWHVGGARLVYRRPGQLRSIGIASLISWRGRWYVVHFGAVLRTGATGVVDSPTTGPGTPGPAGGC
jgi:hypothetical protein